MSLSDETPDDLTLDALVSADPMSFDLGDPAELGIEAIYLTADQHMRVQAGAMMLLLIAEQLGKEGHEEASDAIVSAVRLQGSAFLEALGG